MRRYARQSDNNDDYSLIIALHEDQQELNKDSYLNLSSQKRPTGPNLGGNRLVRHSGTTSRGTVVLVFCLRMRRFPLTLVLTIFVGIKRIAWGQVNT